MTSTTPTRKGLGLSMLTALVAGNMIGSGIFLLPASMASFGSISLLAWIFTSAGALLLALVFAKLGSVMPRIGGPYAYCREAFGDFVGFQMAYNYWVALWVGNAAIAVAFTGYLGFFWPALTTDYVLAFFVTIGIVWVLTFVNMVGVRRAGYVQLVTTVLKLVPLLMIASLGLLFIHPQYLADFNLTGKSNFSALTGAATLTLWAFVGLESATVPAEDVENPQKNIGRATILGVLIGGVVYILSTLAIMGTVPASQLAHSTSPFADAAKVMFGPAGSFLVAIGALISCFGALNGWTLLQGQVPLAAARDGLFPKGFAKISRFGTPIVGLVVSSLLITLLLTLRLNHNLVDQFTFIILLATLSSLIPYFFTAMAELVLLAKYPDLFNRKRLVRTAAVAILGGAYAFWTIAGSGKEIVFYGSMLLFSSVPVYAWMRCKQMVN